MTITLHAWNYGSIRDVTRFKELRQAAKLRLRKAVGRNFQTSISWNCIITTFISRYIFIPGVSKHETSFRAPRIECRSMYDLGKHTQRWLIHMSSFPRSSTWVCADKLSRNSCRCGWRFKNFEESKLSKAMIMKTIVVMKSRDEYF